MRFNRREGWVDDAAQTREHAARQTEAHKRQAAYDEATAQADAPETIPATGRHHRADGN